MVVEILSQILSFQFQVYEEGLTVLPKWLSFNTSTFYGIPLDSDIGLVKIVIDAYLNEDYWVSMQEVFTIDVLDGSDNRLYFNTIINISLMDRKASLLCKTTKMLPPQYCKSGEVGVYVDFLLGNANIQDFPGYKRIELLMSIGKALKICPFQFRLLTTVTQFGIYEQKNTDFYTSSEPKIISLLIACNYFDLLSGFAKTLNESLQEITDFHLGEVNIQNWTISTRQTDIGKIHLSRQRRQMTLPDDEDVPTSISDDIDMSEYITLFSQEVIPTPVEVSSKDKNIIFITTSTAIFQSGDMTSISVLESPLSIDLKPTTASLILPSSTPDDEDYGFTSTVMDESFSDITIFIETTPLFIDTSLSSLMVSSTTMDMPFRTDVSVLPKSSVETDIFSTEQSQIILSTGSLLAVSSSALDPTPLPTNTDIAVSQSFSPAVSASISEDVIGTYSITVDFTSEPTFSVTDINISPTMVFPATRTTEVLTPPLSTSSKKSILTVASSLVELQTSFETTATFTSISGIVLSSEIDLETVSLDIRSMLSGTSEALLMPLTTILDSDIYSLTETPFMEISSTQSIKVSSTDFLSSEMASFLVLPTTSQISPIPTLSSFELDLSSPLFFPSPSPSFFPLPPPPPPPPPLFNGSLTQSSSEEPQIPSTSIFISPSPIDFTSTEMITSTIEIPTRSNIVDETSSSETISFSQDTLSLDDLPTSDLGFSLTIDILPTESISIVEASISSSSLKIEMSFTLDDLPTSSVFELSSTVDTSPVESISLVKPTISSSLVDMVTSSSLSEEELPTTELQFFSTIDILPTESISLIKQTVSSSLVDMVTSSSLSEEELPTTELQFFSTIDILPTESISLIEPTVSSSLVDMVASSSLSEEELPTTELQFFSTIDILPTESISLIEPTVSSSLVDVVTSSSLPDIDQSISSIFELSSSTIEFSPTESISLIEPTILSSFTDIETVSSFSEEDLPTTELQFSLTADASPTESILLIKPSILSSVVDMVTSYSFLDELPTTDTEFSVTVDVSPTDSIMFIEPTILSSVVDTEISASFPMFRSTEQLSFAVDTSSDVLIITTQPASLESVSTEMEMESINISPTTSTPTLIFGSITSLIGTKTTSGVISSTMLTPFVSMFETTSFLFESPVFSIVSDTDIPYTLQSTFSPVFVTSKEINLASSLSSLSTLSLDTTLLSITPLASDIITPSLMPSDTPLKFSFAPSPSLQMLSSSPTTTFFSFSFSTLSSYSVVETPSLTPEISSSTSSQTEDETEFSPVTEISSYLPVSKSASLADLFTDTSTFLSIFPTKIVLPTSITIDPIPTSNIGPLLLSPLGILPVEEGQPFKLVIPAATFLDEGFLNLTAFNGTNGHPLSETSWIRLRADNRESDASTYVLEGLPLSSEVIDGAITDHVILINATDSNGISVTDTLVIRVIPQRLLVNFVEISFVGNFTEFSKNLTAKLGLVNSLGDSIAESGGNIFIKRFENGSIRVTYTDISINYLNCPEFIRWVETTYESNQYTAQFKAKVQPYVPINTPVITGPCAVSQANLESIAPSINRINDKMSESFFILVILLPFAILICLLLISGTILCVSYTHLHKKYQRKVVLKNELEEVFFDHVPVILSDEIEAIPYRSRKPIILPHERPKRGYASLIHQEDPEIGDFAQPQGESNFDEELTPAMITFDSPPPTYQLPPLMNRS